ncbi:unnamed protein product [Cylicocyclus nassatus]|uniref:DDE Tnp4 domain-containing protein n=1 Tax=Cylicocyclus nassatus TaxID=53992 RepID=A0AA36DTI1_CYLNA|nr:unnamed protein product [Cylicocyclus nassatus]
MEELGSSTSGEVESMEELYSTSSEEEEVEATGAGGMRESEERQGELVQEEGEGAVVAEGRRKARVFAERAFPFEVPDDVAFKKDYRFSKRVFYEICDLVKDKLQRSTERSKPLSIPQQVAICLNLLGRNTKQRDSARMAGCASFPGSAHDSRVFKESQLYRDMKNGRKPGCLVGDSAYMAENFLIKVVENPTTQAENRYNRAVCAARSHIERAIGVLKAQFKILGEEYKPELATKIIVACVVLRNIAIGGNESIDEFEVEAEETIGDDPDSSTEPTSLTERAHIRRIISDYFM